MNRNKFCKEIKNQLNEWFDEFRIIKRSPDYCILKCLKFLLLFLKAFGIVSILCFLVIKIPFWKSYLQIRKKPCCIQNVQDVLVIISFIALGAVLFCNYTPCWVLWLVKWRLVEILVVQLSILLLSNNNKITTANFNRSIILFLINIFEVIFAFAIFYLNNKAIGYYTYGQRIKEPIEALYFSIITITTTGFGDIFPINTCGRILAFFEVSIGLLLLIVVFGIFISRWNSKDDRYDRYDSRYYRCRYHQLLIKVHKLRRKK